MVGLALAHCARDRNDHAIEARAGGRTMMPLFMSSPTPALVCTRAHLVLTLHMGNPEKGSFFTKF